MKKIISSFLVLFMAIAITACQGATTRKFTGTKNGMIIESAFTAKGDTIVSQKTVNTIKFADAGFTTQDQVDSLVKQIKQVSADMNKTKGVKDDVQINKDSLVETVEIDYTQADITELLNKKIIQTDAGTTKKLSLKKTADALIAQGFTEVK